MLDLTIKQQHFNGIISAEYAFNDHISLSYNGNLLTNSSTATSYNNGFVFSRVYEGTGTGLDGLTLHDLGQNDIVSNYYQQTSRTKNYYGDVMLNFNYQLFKDLEMKLNLGNNIRDNYTTYNQVGGTNLQIPGFYNIVNVLNPDPFYSLNNGFSRSRTLALFANLDLGYRDYLFLNATYRYDKTSVTSNWREASNNKGYSYYSFGASFIPYKGFSFYQRRYLELC
ncbi:hypothetical protein [Chryseobacterium wanjuense]